MFGIRFERMFGCLSSASDGQWLKRSEKCTGRGVATRETNQLTMPRRTSRLTRPRGDHAVCVFIEPRLNYETGHTEEHVNTTASMVPPLLDTSNTGTA